MTIFSLSNLGAITTITTLRFNYAVEGAGKQIFNFDTGRENLAYSDIDWSVFTATGGFLTIGDHWTISSEGTIVVTGLTGNVSVDRFNNTPPTSNLPFYQQHSVAITMVAILVAIVVIAGVIKVKTRESPVTVD